MDRTKLELEEKKEKWLDILKYSESHASIPLPSEKAMGISSFLKNPPPLDAETIEKYIAKRKIPIQEIIKYIEDLIKWYDELLGLPEDVVDITSHKKRGEPFVTVDVEIEWFENVINQIINIYFPQPIEQT